MAIHVLRVFQQVFICFTLTLRTYALYGCSRRLLKWMLIMGAVFIAASVVGAFGPNLTQSAVDNGHCHEIYTTPTYIIPFIIPHAYSKVLPDLCVSVF
ncbi:hypothetical protein EV424DRAFT_1371848 [Suillus variegatus]|nr:hypothetical protein EV424DRAFT_1371848 [Suillus variegatus]